MEHTTSYEVDGNIKKSGGKDPFRRYSSKPRLEIAVNERNQVLIFHNRPFVKELSWLEFEIGSRDLIFVFADGQMQELGLKVPENLAKHMQNAYQILVVQMDDETGEPFEGNYYPIILHPA